MARVERGNVILRVKDEEVQRYLQLGYNLTDDRGKVLKSAIPNDFATLQRLYIDQTAKIAELEDTVAKLTAELIRYKSVKSEKSEDKPVKTPAKSTTKKSTKA